MIPKVARQKKNQFDGETVASLRALSIQLSFTYYMHKHTIYTLFSSHLNWITWKLALCNQCANNSILGWMIYDSFYYALIRALWVWVYVRALASIALYVPYSFQFSSIFFNFASFSILFRFLFINPPLLHRLPILYMCLPNPSPLIWWSLGLKHKLPVHFSSWILHENIICCAV